MSHFEKPPFILGFIPHLINERPFCCIIGIHQLNFCSSFVPLFLKLILGLFFFKLGQMIFSSSVHLCDFISQFVSDLIKLLKNAIYPVIKHLFFRVFLTGKMRKTLQIYKDSKTPLLQYRIKISASMNAVFLPFHSCLFSELPAKP